ncbi:MAG: nucleotidyltransferase domain-containing protein [Thermodesulfobacteriota bacterium]|nr:nucleotidyltransferase domain-containing protein [Thermodesulfobacteriota bacterium]
MRTQWFGMQKEVLARIVEVLKRNPHIDEAILYGSRAKDSHREGSDVDLVLKGQHLNLREMNKLHLELDDLMLPYTFDLSIYHRLNDQELIDHINRVGKRIYKKE